jgi:hypothetical protein
LKKGRIQLLERLVIPAEAEPAPHLMRGIQVSSTGSLFSQGQVWIPVFTGMTTWVRQQKNLFKELKFYILRYFPIFPDIFLWWLSFNEPFSGRR